MHEIFQRNLRQALAEQTPRWTQEKLAREIGSSTRAVQGWCLGHTVPTSTNLERICKVLGRDAGWFYTDHEKAAA